MSATNIAQLRQQQNADAQALLNPLLNQPHYSKFDPDAWHVMQERDNALIRDELLHGSASDAFVYSFEIKGKLVTGVSVVGARELASQYKGIKSRIVATVEKRGSLFIFRTFSPLSIDTRVLHELADEDDFYECVMEINDIKTANSIEVRKKESRTEKKRDGTTYERPHYDVICESKAFRNGVLSVLPQSVIREFKERCLKSGKGTSNEQTIQQRRAQAAAHAAKHGVSLDRSALAELTFDELSGLGGAAAQGIEAFKRSAAALGLISGVDRDTGEIGATAQPTAAPTRTTAAPTATASPPADWQPTPADLAEIKARELAEAAQDGQAPAARRTRAAGPAME